MTRDVAAAARRRAGVLLLIGRFLLPSGCGPRTPEIQLEIRTPMDRRLFGGLTSLELRAERDGRVIARQAFPASSPYVSLSGVPYGPRTELILEGLTVSGDVAGRGRTCPIDYKGPGQKATLYFSPPNFFAPTAGAPIVTRRDPSAFGLEDGTVIIAGGADASGALASTESFSPVPESFSPGAPLATPRTAAQLAVVSGVATLLTGGRGATGTPIGDAEVYSWKDRQFSRVEGQALDAREGHRLVTLPGSRILLAGGRSPTEGALASTALVRIQADGTAAVSPGPTLNLARTEPAAVVAVGVPVVIGGYGAAGSPLASLEALQPVDSGAPSVWVKIADLRFARAEASATLLDDGSVLVVGGTDGQTVRADAEIYNPITRTTTVLPLLVARRGHTATALPGGRVLIAGGIGATGQPLASVELFAPDVGFVSERSLLTPRSGHVAVPLCDGTVLVVGGADGAEIYSPPAK